MCISMLFACVYIPDFPVEAIVRVEPELREQAVAIVEGKAPLLHVIATNERARRLGIEIGMTQVQAQGYVASLQLRRRSLLQEQAAHAALMDCACAMSPRVHGEAPDTVLLDIDGLERLFGPPAKIARELARRAGELGIEANVGVAANVETAIHASRGFPGTTVIPRGREAERLAGLSVEILFDMRDERAQEMLDTLERWGVRTFRALALLPEVALAQRLGEAGVRLRKLARGEGSRPLVPAEAPLEFEEAVELEDAIELLDGLMFVLNRMLDQLCTRLATRSLAAQELRLRMELNPQQDIVVGGSEGPRQRAAGSEPPATSHETALTFPVPMRDTKVFLKLLQLELQARPPQAPVTKIWLRAEPARPRATQGGLFVPEAPEPERLAVTLARIASVVQKDNCVANFEKHQATDSNPHSQRQNPPRSHGGTEENKSGNRAGAGPEQHTSTSTTAGHANTQRVDELRVGCVEVLDSHRPDAFRVKRFAPGQHSASGSRKNKLHHRGTETQSRSDHPFIGSCGRCGGVIAVRRFRPALVARVRVENARPVRLQATDEAGEEHAGEIVWASGPWRESGEWWNEQHWWREVWDVAVAGETVTVYRIYCERDEWWVEGTYD